MDCGEVKKSLPLYIDGTLKGEEAGEIERHLAGCEDCRSEMAKYIRIREAMSGFEEMPLPEGYELRLKERMDAGTRARSVFTKYFAAAAAAAALFLGIFFANTGSTKDKYTADSARSTTSGIQTADNNTFKSPAKKAAPQYAENREGSVDKNIKAKQNVPSALQTEEMPDIESQDKAVSEEDRGNEDTGEAPKQSLYGIKSAETASPETEASVEETLKKYDAVILRTSEENGYTVITASVDEDMEERLIQDLNSIAEKIEKDDRGNLKIFVRSD